MRRRLLSHLNYANVISTLCLFLLLGGGTAVALNGSNTVFSDDIADGQVKTQDLTAGAVTNPKLASGAVNSAKVADNSQTGADIDEASLTGNWRKLMYTAAPSQLPPTTIAKVGPYEIKGQCLSGQVQLVANGPAGIADYTYVETQNDKTDLGTKSNGLIIPSNTDTLIVQSLADSGNYRRIAGTAMLRSGSVLVQVDFNAVADGRSPPACFIYGTATRAT